MSTGTAETRLRRVVSCMDGQRVPLNRDQRAKIPGEVPYWGANGVVDHVADYLFDEPLVLLGEDGAPFGGNQKDVAFHVTGRTWVNNHIHVLRPIGMDARYLTYALNATDWLPFISGSTRDKLTQDDMLSARIFAPSPDTQRRIADFLDAETSRIDALIAAKQQMIDVVQLRLETLRDQLTMAGNRPTGLPTIPTMGTEWELRRNKTFLREVNDPSADGSEELLSVSHLTGVTPRSDKTVYMFEAQSTVGYKRVARGDLVINTLWAWMGAAGVSQYDGIVSPAYGVYRFDPSGGVDPDWFDMLIRSRRYVDEMTRFSKGVWTSRLRLYPEEFLRMHTPIPPRAIQRRDGQNFRRESERATALCNDLDRQVELLRERRQALITATVSGELDVT